MSGVPVVGAPVFSLAGSQTYNSVTIPAPFRDPMPLGVRVYSITTPGEWWVTRWVDDIQYRSVAPGGFASATITLRLPHGSGTLATPDPVGFSRITELFTRIQVVDLRSAEVAWEGRIEDPARQVAPDTWQIGALGAMVAASDIQRPVFYIDSSADDWVGCSTIDRFGVFFDQIPNVWNNEKRDGNVLVSANRADSELFWIAGDPDLGYIYSWRWASHSYDQPIARFTTTHDGSGPNAAEESNFSLVVGIAENYQIDVTGVEAGSVTKSNVIGTDFTDVNTRYIVLGARRDPGSANYGMTNAAQVLFTKFSNPKVLGLRRDRFANKLTTAASYPGDYVTASQVVEDVVGRLLAGGWYEGGNNTPWPGSVRSQDVYIDATNTTQILHLTYPNGATAADILGDLITKVQTDAYWAIWESRWKAWDSTSPKGFRFEYATWPNNWGYLATSEDGFEGQPNGDDVINYVSYRYPDTADNNQYHVLTGWQGNEMAPELLTGGFTRARTVNKDDPTTAFAAGGLRDAYLAGAKRVLNAGTLTVKRPIQFYDAGVNGWSGAGRMLDPHLIRPGKLVRVIDLPPRAGGTDRAYGAIPPTESLNGTVFKVVATDYSSSDGSCRMELDQVARWQLPTQISAAGGSGSKTIRIQ